MRLNYIPLGKRHLHDALCGHRPQEDVVMPVRQGWIGFSVRLFSPPRNRAGDTSHWWSPTRHRLGTPDHATIAVRTSSFRCAASLRLIKLLLFDVANSIVCRAAAPSSWRARRYFWDRSSTLSPQVRTASMHKHVSVAEAAKLS
jgi:hypothetical protein